MVFWGVGWSVSQGLGQGECFVLDWGQVAECFVQAVVVVPADVGDDRELELALGAPYAVAAQLGLDGVGEAFGERVVAAMVEESLAWRVGRL